ncbi:hypothetical protein F5879DRAFT_923823 [Lentinula edodes]|nr:hypothetical protein F5879DRAFT_923823 [Lentinula edodes]
MVTGATPLGASGPMSTLPEGALAPKILNGATPITYPSISTYSLPSASLSSVTTRSPAPFDGMNGMNGIASPPLPPQASINPSVSRRRTSDYIHQSQEALALSGMNSPGYSTPGLGSPGYANGIGGTSGMNAYNGPSSSGINGMNTYGGYNGYNANGAVNGISTIPWTTIDYPELSSTHPILRPPPAVAAGTLERQDSIKRFPTPPSSSTTGAGSTTPSYPVPSSLSSPSFKSSTSIAPSGISSTALKKLGLSPLHPVPRLKSAEWPPRYWADSPIGTSGLKNMGNTCYMNAPIQCLSATVPFARFFTEVDLKTAINYMNKMNSQGQLTRAFSRLVHDIWHGDMPYITANDFRRTLCSLNAQYIGTSQHDSREFLSFLLDGIHEDTNRIMARKPITRTPEEEERLENLPQQIAGEYEWQVWRQSNDSIIVDFFQGMFRNQLRCMKCEKTSTTYNAFSILSLPVPARSGKIPLQNCLKAFFNVEVMEGDDACNQDPVLVIHLKRFEVNGRFSDKIDTFVDFPVKGLDLTELMPPPLPVGADQSLLNGGMVNGVMSRDDRPKDTDTAFVASRGGWLYCNDISVKNVDAKQVVLSVPPTHPHHTFKCLDTGGRKDSSWSGIQIGLVLSCFATDTENFEFCRTGLGTKESAETTNLSPSPWYEATIIKASRQPGLIWLPAALQGPVDPASHLARPHFDQVFAGFIRWHIASNKLGNQTKQYHSVIWTEGEVQGPRDTGSIKGREGFGHELVRALQPGDRIAILALAQERSLYTPKLGDRRVLRGMLRQEQRRGIDNLSHLVNLRSFAKKENAGY